MAGALGPEPLIFDATFTTTHGPAWQAADAEARANKMKAQFETIMKELDGAQLAKFTKLLHV